MVDALHNVPVAMKVEGREEIKTPSAPSRPFASADGGRRRGQEPGQYLGLVHR